MNMKPVIPFEPKVTHAIPTGDRWVAQIKWDGVRVLSYGEGNETRLFNRKLNERTLQYPELVPFGKYCDAQSAILDGEIISLAGGKPSFHQVMKRDSLRSASSVNSAASRVPIVYMIFDVLYYNGQWVTGQPLSERQRIMERIVKPNASVQLVGNVADTKGLFDVTGAHGLEGVVYKDLRSTYAIDGKDSRWQKKKHYKDLNAVVGGVTFRGKIVNALLLGLYDDQGRLFYIGHAGAGKMTMNDWRNVTELSAQLQAQTMPFANRPERMRDAVWLKPVLTVKVQYLEWTADGVLRQPIIQGLVQAAAADCKLEQI